MAAILADPTPEVDLKNKGSQTRGIIPKPSKGEVTVQWGSEIILKDEMK
jgi:hypothetical protein